MSEHVQSGDLNNRTGVCVCLCACRSPIAVSAGLDFLSPASAGTSYNTNKWGLKWTISRRYPVDRWPYIKLQHGLNLI